MTCSLYTDTKVGVGPGPGSVKVNMTLTLQVFQFCLGAKTLLPDMAGRVVFEIRYRTLSWRAVLIHLPGY